MFAPIYAALASNFHISPRDADQLEIWEVAALFKLDEDEAAAVASGDGRTRDIGRLKARLAHAAGKGPKPTPGPSDARDLMAALGGEI